jgi:hypothetical protein
MEKLRTHESALRDAARERAVGAAPERPVERSTDEARQAVTGHNVRYVLGFGLLGVIIGMVIVFLIEHGLVYAPS